ncbi:hypothetical protein [Devosia geojensis]|nr:hypothetical protein [Devosia geojensis]
MSDRKSFFRKALEAMVEARSRQARRYLDQYRDIDSGRKARPLTDR